MTTENSNSESLNQISGSDNWGQRRVRGAVGIWGNKSNTAGKFLSTLFMRTFKVATPGTANMATILTFEAL